MEGGDVRGGWRGCCRRRMEGGDAGGGWRG